MLSQTKVGVPESTVSVYDYCGGQVRWYVTKVVAEISGVPRYIIVRDNGGVRSKRVNANNPR